MSKKVFRRSRYNDDDDDDDDDTDVATGISSTKPFFRRLSFQDEEVEPSSSFPLRSSSFPLRSGRADRLSPPPLHSTSKPTPEKLDLSSELGDLTQIDLRPKKLLFAEGDDERKRTLIEEINLFSFRVHHVLMNKSLAVKEAVTQRDAIDENLAAPKFIKRVTQTADEMLEVNAGLRAVKSIFSAGGTPDEAQTAAVAAIIAARLEREKLPEERAGAFANLMYNRAHQKKNLREYYCVETSHLQGEFSTDESDDSESDDSESDDNESDHALQSVEDVFRGESKEFMKLSTIKAEFERWKEIYPEGYRSLNLSSQALDLFSMYVRLELLQWDPLHERRNFNKMQWYKLLCHYGSAEKGAYNQDDDDGVLIPALIHVAALPILHHQVANCWQVHSSKETKNLVYAAKLAMEYVPASSDGLQNLWFLIDDRISDYICCMEVPVWSTRVIELVHGADWFAGYLFGRSILLLKNILLWIDVLPLPVLHKLAMELFVGKILPHLRVPKADMHNTISKTERVVFFFKRIWAGPDSRTRSFNLDQLVEFVETLATRLIREHHLGENDDMNHKFAPRLVKILVDLHEHRKAQELVSVFKLEQI